MARKDFITIEDNNLTLELKNLPSEIEDALLKETRIQSGKLTTYIIKNHLTKGTTDTKLSVRSGTMRTTTLPIIPLAYSPKMKGGTRFAAPYARTHVGPKGQITKIRPISSKYLAIPIGKALSGGVPKFSSPKQVPGLDLVVSKQGNLLLAKLFKGGQSELYFLLKKEVNVPARVHPEDILSKNVRRIAEDYNKALELTLSNTLGII